ncbi:3-hydroxybenzoate 6-monooxygenase [Paraburkholderia lycopersici]|uniref:3-hydroxybenzoate 6-hydroxylase n=1 Tax=Paraburkholderia lycopersici TaxID=416944 RepID=A0A1G6QYS1_9BURK|nr:3-hydroxybenzoate 6-monooxygenase [Paraburkholderia lycopersici]SDC97482.1 salicylate hydroxylase [Paraburkholderia lycopersici]
MPQTSRAHRRVIVVGGGIGGLAAALAIARQNIAVLLLEQAPQIGEIGAGIQLGANAFTALDALGAGEAARNRTVYTDSLTLMDAVDAKEIVRIETGDAYRKRFGNPYGVIHRADIHLSIFEAVQGNPLIQFRTDTQIRQLEQSERGVTVIDQHGERYTADAVIGADGVKSAVRAALHGDEPTPTGHVVYRAVVNVENMPKDLQINSPVVWAGPRCHLVHYPLRGGREYNLVVTFHSRQREVWGVTDGSKEEVLSYFEGIHPLPHQMLDRPTSWRRWATADRDPADQWSFGRATILGDAAHPMTQYLAQGACQALEDAVTLGKAIEATDGDFVAAFKLYEQARIPRTARVLWSAREMGRVYHAKGVERLVRNQLWVGRTRDQFYDALEWLYGWRVEDCLKGAV